MLGTLHLQRTRFLIISAISHLKLAAEKNCDINITGEKVLYIIEYAKFTGMNLIISSHTFTEIFGIESLSKKLGKNITI